MDSDINISSFGIPLINELVNTFLGGSLGMAIDIDMLIGHPGWTDAIFNVSLKNDILIV